MPSKAWAGGGLGRQTREASGGIRAQAMSKLGRRRVLPATVLRGWQYLVVVLHVLEVTLLTDEQVQVLLPICVHGLHVRLPREGGDGGGVGRCPGYKGRNGRTLDQRMVGDGASPWMWPPQRHPASSRVWEERGDMVRSQAGGCRVQVLGLCTA